MPRLIVRTAILIMAVSAILYLLVTGYMFWFQRDIMYNMEGNAAEVMAGADGISVETATMDDGTEITAWRAESSDPTKPTVLYFHGNSGNLSDREPRFRQILDSGFGLYAPTYRGYPGGGGSPSEDAFIADAFEHFDRIAGDGRSIVLLGESLGTGVATAVATGRDAEALILEAPYTATVDVAAERYPWLPVHWLMLDQFVNRDRIGDVTEPVLIIHGTADETTPYAHGVNLHERANEPKEVVTFDAAGHNDLWARGLWRQVIDFLDRQTGSSG